MASNQYEGKIKGSLNIDCPSEIARIRLIHKIKGENLLSKKSIAQTIFFYN